MANLIASGLGFILIILGILGAMFWQASTSGNHLWWVIIVLSILLFSFILIFPITMDKIRREYAQKHVKIFKKNKEFLDKYDGYLQSKKDI